MEEQVMKTLKESPGGLRMTQIADVMGLEN